MDAVQSEHEEREVVPLQRAHAHGSLLPLQDTGHARVLLQNVPDRQHFRLQSCVGLIIRLV